MTVGATTAAGRGPQAGGLTVFSRPTSRLRFRKMGTGRTHCPQDLGASVVGSDRFNPHQRAGRPKKIRIVPSSRSHGVLGAMSTDDAFGALMARLRSGEDAAAKEVFDRFSG